MLLSKLGTEMIKILYCAIKASGGEHASQTLVSTAAKFAAEYQKPYNPDERGNSYLPVCVSTIEEILRWIEAAHMQSQFTGQALPTTLKLTTEIKLLNSLNLVKPERIWAALVSSHNSPTINTICRSILNWEKAFHAEQHLPPDFDVQVCATGNVKLATAVDDIVDEACNVIVFRCLKTGVRIRVNTHGWMTYTDIDDNVTLIKFKQKNGHDVIAFKRKNFLLRMERESVVEFDHKLNAFVLSGSPYLEEIGVAV